MLPLHYARHWRVASLALLISVLAAALMPTAWLWPDRGRILHWFVDGDKWLHGTTFVMLAIWFAGQYRPTSYWRIGIGLFFFGILIEACQWLVTYRSTELFDIVADSIGIGIGLAVAMAGLGGWSQRFENWYSRRATGARID